MSTHHTTAPLAGARIDSPGAAAEHALGTRVDGTDGTEWVYVRASAAFSQYDYVTIDETFRATAGIKSRVDDGHAIAVAQAGFATGDYGWVATGGHGAALKVNVLPRCAADRTLYTTNTAGMLDDTASGQTKIGGIVITSSNSTSPASRPAIISHPRAG